MNADNVFVNLSGTIVETWFKPGSHAIGLTLLCAMANGSVVVPVRCDINGALDTV